MINAIIVNALKSLGVPVSFRNYGGTATPYITFFCYNEQGEAWAENEEIATGYYVQVDVWSKGDYSLLADKIESSMRTAGFTRSTSQDMPYETDAQLNHKAIRFSYIV